MDTENYLAIFEEKVGQHLGQKEFYSTAEVCAALNKELPENTTSEKMLYRVREGLFSPLPKKVGRTYIWSKESIGAIYERLNDEFENAPYHPSSGI